MDTLQTQVVTRLRIEEGNALVKVLADYATELGVPIPLTTRNYEVLLDFAHGFTPAEVNIFDKLKTKIDNARRLSVTYMDFSSGSGPSDGSNIFDQLADLFKIKDMDDLSAIIFTQLVSPDAELKRAFESMLAGNAGLLEQLAYETSKMDVTIFPAGSPQLVMLGAVQQAVNIGDRRALVRLLNPGYPDSLLKFGHFYVSLPDTPEREAIDALADALKYGHYDDLKALLKKEATASTASRQRRVPLTPTCSVQATASRPPINGIFTEDR